MSSIQNDLDGILASPDPLALLKLYILVAKKRDTVTEHELMLFILATCEVLVRTLKALQHIPAVREKTPTLLPVIRSLMQILKQRKTGM